MADDMSETGGPAYPQNFLMHQDEVITSGNLTAAGFQGLSLRDYFAGQVVCGLLGVRPDSEYDTVASAAYAMADAMLAARK